MDKSFLKAVQCTRRAGKTTGEVGEQLEEAMYISPGSKHLFMALSLDSARNIAWDMIIETLDKHKINHKSHRQTGEVFLPNGSYYRLFGLDSSYKAMRKVLGGKYKTVKIDESGSVTQDLKKLCYQMIMPALTDLDGRLTLLGTAENIPRTFFEQVTSGKEPGWSLHKWTTLDNPYMKEEWSKHLAWINQNNPTFKLTSEYKTHYLNEWCADDMKLIVKMTEHSFCEEKDLTNYHYVLGVDLGYNDATAYSVCAYSSTDPHGYIVSTSKEKGQDITSVAGSIRALMVRYPISRIMVDGANKQGVEEMRVRHRLPLTAAEKTDKATFLKLMSDDVKQGKIKLFPGTKDLQEEWAKLQWKDEYQDTEDDRCENHCFVAGTIVTTSSGIKKIESIELGDLILTRNGYSPLMVKHESITNDLMEIVTSHGTVRCTSGHKFWTTIGWVEARHLTDQTRIYTTGAWEKLTREYSTESNSIDTQNLKDLPTETTLEQEKMENPSTYTERYGFTITEKYLTGITFITKTATLFVTTLVTLTAWMAASTFLLILPKRKSRDYCPHSQKQEKKPQNGTDQKLASNGTEISGRFPLEKKEKRPVFFVSVAGIITTPTLTGRRIQDGARLSVLQRLAEIQELIISNSSVIGASPYSLQTSMQTEDAAPLAVMLRKQTLSGSHKVYNLTVKDTHEYFANGLLAKNCSDSTLYAWRFVRNYMYTAPINNEEFGTDKYMSNYAKELKKRRYSDEYGM